MANEAWLDVVGLPNDIRIRRHGGLTFAFYYGPDSVELTAAIPSLSASQLLLGDANLKASDVAIWKWH